MIKHPLLSFFFASYILHFPFFCLLRFNKTAQLFLPLFQNWKFLFTRYLSLQLVLSPVHVYLWIVCVCLVSTLKRTKKKNKNKTNKNRNKWVQISLLPTDLFIQLNSLCPTKETWAFTKISCFKCSFVISSTHLSHSIRFSIFHFWRNDRISVK